MSKRYDYGRMAFFSRLFLIAWTIVLLYFVHIGKSVEGLMPVTILITGGFALLLLIHFHLQTYIEVSEEGFVYNGWRKQFSSSWQAVTKIRIMGGISKIYTDQGNFVVGQIRYAGEVKADAAGGFIEEIRRNARHAKVIQSFIEFE